MNNYTASFTRLRTLNRDNWAKDFVASLVVFLVALPLCMGIAIASGVPPILGLLSGIIGGLIIGPLSGAPLQVSGPAAGLAVMVFQFTGQYGVESLFFLGLIIGVVQITAAKLGWGSYFKAVSPSLLKGMLCGIGVLILFSQIYVGIDLKPEGNALVGMINFPQIFWQKVWVEQSHLAPFLACLLSLAVMNGWSKVPGRLKEVFPAPLIAVVSVSLVCLAFGSSVQRIDIPDNLIQTIQFIDLSNFSQITPMMLFSALGIALIASTETLLCTKATDIIAKSRSSDYNKEIFAQGVGHLFVGLLGALPVTGVIVRSTANIQAGAKGRLSTTLHGLWLLLLVFLAPAVLEFIPISVLAAVLIATAIKLIDFRGVQSLVTSSRQNAFIFLATFAGIIGVDLLTGVIIGFVASLLVLVFDLLKLEIKTETAISDEGAHLKLNGKLSFLHIPKLDWHLAQVDHAKEVTLDLHDLDYIDQGASEELKNWKSLRSSHQTSLKIIPPKNQLKWAI